MSAAAVVVARGVRKRFPAARGGRETVALDGVSLEAPAGALTALVGPDGAGKTTLLRLVAGLMRAEGALRVLDIDVAADPQAVQDRISYMPQRFGLYEDLSVQENLDLYADLHGVSREQRRGRYARLLEMTDLGRFTARLAGKLSGGMKQKLGLACTLVRSPELLLLDEPTVGVDPLSRRELWQIVQQLVDDERLSVIVSTTYLDEAERCARVFVLHEGRLLAQGRPEDIRRPAHGLCFVTAPRPGEPARLLQARLLDDTARIIDAVPQGGEVRVIRRPAAGEASSQGPEQALAWRPAEARLEDGFMVLLRERQPAEGAASPPLATTMRSAPADNEAIIEVRDLVRKFGDFVAVDRTSFSVTKGEIFGLLGPNGAGKTTTFRMLCGLLPASSGFLRVAGVDLRTAPARARRRVGYVSQRFALYGNLSVMENLTFFGSAYGLHGERLRARIGVVLAQFGLETQAQEASGRLPGGYRQRLAMAVALLHEPDILFLDEPTSGADALARREFWRRITTLAAGGTTIVVTTHFMEEAEYCDRIVIQDAGRLLALGTPEQVRRQAGETDARRLNMEEAFIGIVEHSRRREGEAEAVA
ncbi:ATP-binding cassette domain-containing protein [Pigmentiphaga sp.]|uniref:ATP-binding cassette domain-containing protein n=1 Tax=Pigmentiphaga sp. TaxID=1977564 RepID=UPI00128D921F|nr:ATP-binding cassette domain-containing protein [Pigmentiphaga sp.]MPS29193.1 ABC transporter ATP-binding protein [Alcaligenaceae bacterium SAGV5]MPS50461.1 ABC transporter ATP-binding protein [Alcaligenaceae bacterium SAGV3]MPT59768.1 ABC transporter ATP-binding protein [Alcaligenaceae bacterium]